MYFINSYCNRIQANSCKGQSQEQIIIVSMDEVDNQNLESIIALINHQKNNTFDVGHNYHSLKVVPNTYQVKPKNSENYSINLIQNPKTLIFKPWSGTSHAETRFIEKVEEIKEQIVGEDTDHEEVIDKEQRLTQETNQVISENGYYYKFQNGPVKLIKQLLQENGFKNIPANYEDWTLYWSSGPVKPQVYPQLNPYQKVNHFPNSFQITRKDLMNKNISKMQIKYGLSNFNFLPKTYILPLERPQFQQQYNKNKQIYIVKPHNRSQGKGIIVTDEIDVIYSRLQKYSSIVVSEYIDNPLLINGYKFDLRIYVGITSIYPLKIYINQEGLARFATQKYNNSMSEQKKSFRHLTNYSVNKKNQNFVSSSAPDDDYFGSKWSLTSLKDFLQYNIGKNQATELFERIQDLVIKTILSIQNLLFTNVSQYVPYINNCFQILGFDVLIDSGLKPWLVQVNLSPSMNTDSPLDLKIKGSMVADMFTMLGVSTHSQRYSNNSHLRNLTSKHMNSRGNKNQLQSFQKYILREMQSQNCRCGSWKRVFPSSSSYKYTGFFEIDRYLNIIARQSIKQITPIRRRVDPLKYRSSVQVEVNHRSQSKGKQVKLKPQNKFLPRRPSIKFRIR